MFFYLFIHLWLTSKNYEWTNKILNYKYSLYQKYEVNQTLKDPFISESCIKKKRVKFLFSHFVVP